MIFILFIFTVKSYEVNILFNLKKKECLGNKKKQLSLMLSIDILCSFQERPHLGIGIGLAPVLTKKAIPIPTHLVVGALHNA